MKRRATRLSSIVAALALAAGFLAGCALGPTPPVPTFVPRNTPTPRPGEVYTVDRGTLAETLEVRGRVVARQEELLFFPLHGYLKALELLAGDLVQAGQVIAELDAPTIEDNLLESEYRLQVAKGGLARAEVRQDTLQLQIEALTARTEALAARIEALNARIEALNTQMERQQAADGYRVAAARGDREVAKAGVDACGAQLPRMEEAIPQAEARLRRAQFRYESVQYGWEEDPKTGDPIPMPFHYEIMNEYEAAQRGLAQAKASLAEQKATCAGLKSAVDRWRTEVNYYTKVQGLEVRRLEAERDGLEAERDGLEAERDGLEADKNRLGKEKEINELTIQTSEHEVRYRQTVVERFQERLAETQLEAPFDGVIVSIEKQVGEELEPYQPLGAIADPSVFRVEATVLEEDILKVAMGQPASVALDAYAANLYEATVTEIGAEPIVWQGKNAYTIYLEFVEPALVPASIRMGADAEILVTERVDVLLVPMSAVVGQGARNFATRVNEDGSLEQVEVDLGATDGQWAEVVAGLVEGDEIQIP